MHREAYLAKCMSICPYVCESVKFEFIELHAQLKMSPRFKGGDYIQRGRGIGGLLRMAKSFFMPLVKTAGCRVLKAAKSNTGKMIGNTIKEQAISSGTNLIADAVRGNDMKESLHNEGQNKEKSC